MSISFDFEPVEFEQEKPYLSTGAKRIPNDEPQADKKAHPLTRYEMTNLMGNSQYATSSVNKTDLYKIRKVGEKYELLYQKSGTKVSDNVVKKLYNEYYL